ncbi:LysR family transcriptional regulator [Vibrio hangzhouensis]|uniref:DNA-binding transcriptional regulator, LysR family n=1 Tax=Vibrio hangzhouensis TaxID=462991 RepID=A0A1H6BWW8_9VIBR|nr:LysR family transcriptional regulator [Vibrio hangzhouensis]SEG52609.1 DNA-binding transcriptional regulator, LysR family [Vibrio hangzhouensis]SEG65180.1 DNA-binding transcriptional regulator, LysR family [Vibrio hangzhouensis]
MTLDQIITFVAIAHSGSMRKAARALGKSQPAITSAIHRLEASLGADVFIKGTRPVRLSEFGQRFYRQATELENLLHLTETFSQCQTAETLRVCFEQGVSEQEISALSMLLLRECPLRSLDLFSAENNEIQRLLVKQEIDMAITLPFQHLAPHLHSESVGQREFIEVCSPITQGQAHREMFVHGPKGQPLWHFAEEIPTNALSFNQPAQMLRAILTFHGKGWLPKAQVASAIDACQLVTTGRGSVSMEYRLIWHHTLQRERRLLTKLAQLSRSFQL